MDSLDPIREQAARWGVETAHYDGLGRHRQVDPSVLARILEVMVAPLYAFDRDNVLQLVNAAGTDLLQRPYARCFGHSARELGLEILLAAPDQSIHSFSNKPARWMLRRANFRQDGRPYDVRATSGVQDIRQPNIIELKDLEAKFETTTKTTVRVAAPQGVYDSSKDFMRLNNDIRVTSDSGYDIRMKNADVDFKAGRITSLEPVSVVMSGGTVTADSLTVNENGGHILFEGDVHTVLHSRDDGAAAGESKP